MMVAQGDAQPLPDWIGYLVSSEQMHCSPWDLLTDPTLIPRGWWAHKSLVWNEAKNIVREQDRALQESRNRTNAMNQRHR
jgi:hypothetical protein